MTDRFIDLLRHGATEGGPRFNGRSDPPLTDSGWGQVRAAVGNSHPWRQVYSSPRRRCRAFAETLGLPLVIEDDFAEIDFGDWDGLPPGVVARNWPHELQRYWEDLVGYTPPGAESLPAFRGRVIGAWQALLDNTRGDTLVVAHGGTLRVIVAEVLAMPLGAIQRLEWPHAGMARIRVGTGRATSLVRLASGAPPSGRPGPGV